MEKRISYRVPQDYPLCSVEQILRREMGLTSHQIKSAKYRANGICINNRQVRITEQISGGDLVEVLLESGREASRQVEAVQGPLDILYEDEDLLLVNKPAGLAVHPAHGHHRDTLANYLMYYFESRGKQACIRAVGRLDKDTSGIVVFAKNKVAAARLNAGMEKEYLALVQGHLCVKQGCIEKPIGKRADRLNQMEVFEDGRFARTHYQVLEEFQDSSLVCLRLDTGRTHQIRVHMAFLGHPLVGDSIYGNGSRGERLQRAALHCGRVTLLQPFTGEKIRVCAPLPQDMRGYMQGCYCSEIARSRCP